MITCAERGFCFIHIPKTGGTTVRFQVKDLDDYDLKFGPGIHRFPEGQFRGSHIPLAVIERHFPDVLETISGLRTFAVVRDPTERFFSAFNQHLKEGHGKFSRELSDRELRDMLSEVCDHVGGATPYPDVRFSHFLRQTDFTDLNGARFVKTVIPIENLNDLVAELSRLTGRQLDAGMKLNQSVNFRHRRLKAPIIALKDRLKAVLPLSMYSRVKDVGLSVFADRRSDERLHAVSRQIGVSNFIEEHYAGDFALRSEVLELPKRANAQEVTHAH